MAQFSTFWAGVIAFFLFNLVGFVLTFYVGGMLLDPVYTAGMDLPHGCETTYATMQAPLPWFLNGYYAIGICCSLLGSVIFGQAIVKRVRVSRYEYR